jgi:hypothetical protein
MFAESILQLSPQFVSFLFGETEKIVDLRRNSA